MPSIRPRTDADLGACVSVLSLLYESEDYPKGANRDLKYFLTNEKNQQCWVAESDGKIVGHVSTSTIAHDPAIDLWKSLHPDDQQPTSLLSRLFVLPEYRKHGVAVDLIKAAVTSNIREGLRPLLGVMTNSEAAIRLYDRLGWVRYGITTHVLDDGQRSDAICFASPSQFSSRRFKAGASTVIIECD